MGKGDSFGKRFTKAVAIRATKTFCQAFAAGIGTAAVMGDVDWMYVLSASALAALLSVLMSVATGLPEVKIPELDYEDLDEHV